MLSYRFDLHIFANPSTLFLSTDNHVYISRYLGNSWKTRPRACQCAPHCSLLNMAAYNEGKQRFLYLASWERLLRRRFTLMGR
jgi:hypothetical protein